MKRLLVILVFFLCHTGLFSQIEIELRRTFIDSIRNWATLDVDFLVDKSKPRANSPSKDGDIHIAGRSAVIGLPIVVEIMNARYQPQAVNLAKNKQGTNELVKLTGVWRFWCEHSGSSKQIQGTPLSKFTTTNPDHVFEFHPVTKFGGIDVINSLYPTQGYRFKDAERAFHRYDNTRCHIYIDGAMVKIVTYGVGYNYVDFIIELNEKPFDNGRDGKSVFCKVYDPDGELLSYKTRMVFVNNSEPEIELRDLDIGDQMRVIGIPRINMSIINWRINQTNRPEVLEWNLPYEMVIVGYIEPN